jgi:hypothetical protein
MVLLIRMTVAGALLVGACSCLGQTSSPASAVVQPGESLAYGDDAVAQAIERARTRSVMAAFSLPAFPEDTESAYDGIAFFPQQPPANSQQPPSPASTNPPPPNLNDLGFPPAQTQGNPLEQARLDRRSHMLKIHQRLGLITAAPLVATVISGTMAGGRSTSSTTRDLHAALGSATAGLYFTTAYFSIFAPKVPGTQARGPIRLHRALAWIHGPGMVLTPVLGALAFEQKSRGERVHGIASAHGAVAIVTAGAYGLAIASVSFRF